MKLPRICGGFLNLTQKCNLACKYCFVCQQPKEMTYKTAKDAVDFYAKNAVLEAREPGVTFFGGEPMLKYEEIVKPLVKYIRATYGDYSISITTNGTLLNEEVYEFFKENDVGMLLSLDGMEEIQNHNRPYHSGKGSFKDIDIQMHLKYYPGGTFRATVDPDKVHLLYENYLWGEEQGFTNCAFILNSEGDWTEKKVQIFKDQLDQVAKHIIEAEKAGEKYMAYNEFDSKKKEYRMLQRIDENYFRDDGQDRPACGTCGLGASVFASIGSSGDIYSCQEMTENPDHNEFIIGNIYTGMNEEKRIELANSFNARNVRSEEEGRCKRCKLNPICNGGCVLHNFWNSGTLDIMPKITCQMYEYYLEKVEEIEGGK